MPSFLLSSLLLCTLFGTGCTAIAPVQEDQPVAPAVSSTPLNERYLASEEDPYCMDLNSSGSSPESIWEPLEDFLEGHFGEGSAVLMASLEDSLAESPERQITSVCRYAEELYVSELQGNGEEFQGYRVYTAVSEDEQFEIGQFLVPFGGQVSLSTALFDDSLGMSTRWEGTGYENWYFYKVGMDADSIEQVEWCEMQDSILNCEYQYEEASDL